MSTLSRQIIKRNILASIINHLRFRGEGGSRRPQTDQTSQFLHALVGYFPLRVVFMLKRTFAHFFNPMLLSSLGVFPLCHAKCFAAPTAGSAWSLTWFMAKHNSANWFHSYFTNLNTESSFVCRPTAAFRCTWVSLEESKRNECIHLSSSPVRRFPPQSFRSVPIDSFNAIGGQETQCRCDIIVATGWGVETSEDLMKKGTTAHQEQDFSAQPDNKGQVSASKTNQSREPCQNDVHTSNRYKTSIIKIWKHLLNNWIIISSDRKVN